MPLTRIDAYEVHVLGQHVSAADLAEAHGKVDRPGDRPPGRQRARRTGNLYHHLAKSRTSSISSGTRERTRDMERRRLAAPLHPVGSGLSGPGPGQGTRGCPSVIGCETLVSICGSSAATSTRIGLSFIAAGTRMLHLNVPCDTFIVAVSFETEQVTFASAATSSSLHVTRPLTVAHFAERAVRIVILSASALERPVACSSAAAASSTP